MAKKKKSSSQNGSPNPEKGRRGKKSMLQYAKLPMRRHVLPTEKPVFSNHVVVRTDPATVQLLFFDAQLPVIVDSEKSSSSEPVEAPTVVDAFCISRVLIPHYLLPKLIRALQTNLEQLPELVAIHAAAQEQEERDSN